MKQAIVMGILAALFMTVLTACGTFLLMFIMVFVWSTCEQIRALDEGEAGRYFNIDYQRMGNFFTSLNE